MRVPAKYFILSDLLNLFDVECIIEGIERELLFRTNTFEDFISIASSYSSIDLFDHIYIYIYIYIYLTFLVSNFELFSTPSKGGPRHTVEFSVLGVERTEKICVGSGIGYIS